MNVIEICYILEKQCFLRHTNTAGFEHLQSNRRTKDSVCYMTELVFIQRLKERKPESVPALRTQNPRQGFLGAWVAGQMINWCNYLE